MEDSVKSVNPFEKIVADIKKNEAVTGHLLTAMEDLLRRVQALEARADAHENAVIERTAELDVAITDLDTRVSELEDTSAPANVKALQMCQKIVPSFNPGQHIYTLLVTYTLDAHGAKVLGAAILTQDHHTYVERKALRHPDRVEIPSRYAIRSALQDGMVGFVYALTRDEYLMLEANDGPGGKFIVEGVGKDGAPAHQTEAYRAGGLECENC
jgi:hypothetical protein